MSLEVVITLVVLGVALALLGVVWLHGHKSGFDNAVSRATTIPNGVAQKMDSVVPGSSTALQNAANQAAATATNMADKVS